MKTLILGLGNTLLKDDGVGIYAAREIKQRVNGNPDITVTESSESGMALLDLLIGYDALVVIDAIVTESRPQGSLYRLKINDIGKTPVACSPHFTGLPSVIEFGEQCGYKMPARIEILAIEVEDPYTIDESLNPVLAEAIPLIVDTVSDLVAELNN